MYPRHDSDGKTPGHSNRARQLRLEERTTGSWCGGQEWVQTIISREANRQAHFDLNMRRMGVIARTDR